MGPRMGEAPRLGHPQPKVLDAGRPEISRRVVSCPSASQAPPYWVWQTP
jgi:hypothetical protein